MSTSTSLLQVLAAIDWEDVGQAGIDTLLMLGGSLIFTTLLGLPLGIALFLFDRGQLLASPKIYGVLSLLVNVLRSLPFVILLIVLIPFTLLVTGTSLGVAGAIPPLV